MHTDNCVSDLLVDIRDNVAKNCTCIIALYFVKAFCMIVSIDISIYVKLKELVDKSILRDFIEIHTSHYLLNRTFMKLCEMDRRSKICFSFNNIMFVL